MRLSVRVEIQRKLQIVIGVVAQKFVDRLAREPGQRHVTALGKRTEGQMIVRREADSDAWALLLFRLGIRLRFGLRFHAGLIRCSLNVLSDAHCISSRHLATKR